MITPTTRLMKFTVHKSFSDIVNRYDGFILDQFGVMHNGKESLPGAADCINQLSSLGKKLIILSNTSSPSEVALSKLPKMDFDRSDFQGAVTSGEEASQFIRSKYGSGEDTKKALWFTWDQSESQLRFLEKCGNIEATHNIDEADFIIAHGSSFVRNSVEKGSDGLDSIVSLGSFFNDGTYTEIDPLLEKCKERNLAMVCANPDFIVKMANGKIGHMPGKIALRYENMGAECKYFGKPHMEHFQACLEKLGMRADQVAHVGDSLHHDIVGANAAGIASIFITSGIHCEDLGAGTGILPDESVLGTFFENEGDIYPTHVLPMLQF